MIGRRDILRALISTPLGAWLRPWGRVLPANRPCPGAPTHYRQAFAWLSNLTEHDKELIRGWKAAPLDRAARRLLRRASPALSALHRGASIPGCEWEEVVALDKLCEGHLDPGNLTIGKIALIRARASAAAGRGRDAVDDVFAVAGFGRHLGGAGLLISRLFEGSLENEAIACLAAILPQLDRSTLAAIPARIVDLPPLCTWAHMMRQEARFIASIVVAKIEAAESPIGLATLQETGLETVEAEAILERTGGDRGRVLDLVEGVVPSLASLAEILDLPHDLFGPALDDFKSRPSEINPFAGSVVQNAEHMRYTSDRTEVLWSMVLAVSAMIGEGPDRFESIADPYGDGPFAYQPLGEGFELRSALHREGKLPAILYVGTGVVRTISAVPVS